MKKSIKTIVIGCWLGLLAGCATVTISPAGQPKIKTTPTYEAKQSFFLVGLIGERHVDVQSICGNRAPRQLQTVDTFSDKLIGGLTLGIYTPRTARVWCEDRSENI